MNLCEIGKKDVPSPSVGIGYRGEGESPSRSSYCSSSPIDPGTTLHPRFIHGTPRRLGLASCAFPSLLLHASKAAPHAPLPPATVNTSMACRHSRTTRP
ncbi:hypothetical protein KSP39_PZI014119 [Platanthera zijinensis]|uniref:Uncharacterized protein n=1 Tax=Platanthera zijinensis TaxID=2320716 RepID=A0AAP0G3Y3_9ASPA